jgi:hypothetical protein
MEAEKQKEEAERQTTLALEAEREAENLREIAEQNLEAFRKLKETEIGSFYQGGYCDFLL